MNTDTILTTKQVATRWGVSVTYVIKKVQAGEIRSLTPDNPILKRAAPYTFSLAEVERFEIAAREAASSDRRRAS